VEGRPQQSSIGLYPCPILLKHSKYVFFNGIAIENRSQPFMHLLYNLPEFWSKI